ncbi:MAG: alpha/beta hydrolase domain-containing protein [Dehalococcoidia bacterium]
MSVTHFEILRREPFAGGEAFGSAGPYERIDGVVHFAVDPFHEANLQIVDLQLAARGAGGCVHFDADFTILQPVDPMRGNGALLFDVANRGGKPALGFLNNRIAPLEPTDEIPATNGFLFRRGFTVAWCGWQWDVPAAPGLTGLRAPEALDADGLPIRGQVNVQVVRNTSAASVRLCDGTTGAVTFATYPAADLNEAGARMTVQEWPDGPRTEIPRARWRFARLVDRAVVPDRDHVWLEGGFEPGKVYDIQYTTDRCPIVGTGLLAVRDFVSALRSDPVSPCEGAVNRTIGFGVSQSGRFLRTFVYQGLNLDEAGRQVFDGLMPVVAGARRGEFNHRHAQPSVEVTPGFGHLPPWAEIPDGERPGLFDRQRAAGGVPKVVAVNTSAEYWRGDAWLAHTSPDAARDIGLAPESRSYLIVGSQHSPGIWPLLSRLPIPDGAVAAHWMNAVDTRPACRAALMNLDAWVRDGLEPPPSAIPSLAAGTLVERGQVLASVALPGMAAPDPEKMRHIAELDLGPTAGEGIGRWPATPVAALPAFVAAVDADGNEVAGIRYPDVEVPVATYTGWNPRHREMGAPDQLVRYTGSTFPFASNEAWRTASGDPRPSIETRYGNRDAYQAKVRASADALVAAHYLLEEDVADTVRRALSKFDAVAKGIPAVPDA